MDRKRLLRNPLLWIVALLLVYYAFTTLFDSNRGYTQVSTSQALEQVTNGNVTDATIGDKEQQLKLDLKNPVSGTTKILAYYPGSGNVVDDIFKDLQGAKVSYDTKVTQDSFFTQILIYLVPLGLLLLLLMWMMNNVQGGGNRVLNFGKSRAKQLPKDMPKTTFSDVAGCDEAVDRKSTRLNSSH